MLVRFKAVCLRFHTRRPELNTSPKCAHATVMRTQWSELDFFFFPGTSHIGAHIAAGSSHTPTRLSAQSCHCLTSGHFLLYWLGTWNVCASVSDYMLAWSVTKRAQCAHNDTCVLIHTCARCCSSLRRMSCRVCVCVLALRQVRDGGWDRQDSRESNTLSASSFPTSDTSWRRRRNRNTKNKDYSFPQLGFILIINLFLKTSFIKWMQIQNIWQ